MLHVLQKNLAFSVKCRIRRAQTKYCRSQWRRGVCWRRSEGGREKNVVSLQHVSNPKEEALPWGPPEDIGQMAFGEKKDPLGSTSLWNNVAWWWQSAAPEQVLSVCRYRYPRWIAFICIVWSLGRILLEVYFLPWVSYLFQIVFDGVAQRSAGRCDAERGLAPYCGGLQTPSHVTLCSRAHTTPILRQYDRSGTQGGVES